MHARRTCFGDAAWPAGDNDAADAVEQIGRRVDRQHVALNAGFAHSPRQQMTVLPARIENRDTVHGEIIVEGRRPT